MITLKIPQGPRFAAENKPEAAPPPPRLVSLCDICAYARVIRGFRSYEQIISCGYSFPSVHVPFVVVECTDYKPKRDRSEESTPDTIVVDIPPLEVVSARSEEAT
ncbi:MAG TPA: hypothetical protein VLY23_18680 [Candidatus Acidoferrum sp.]|nr:hypothetical protein [Candidatus Acidoferrum sp.]